MIMAPLPAYFPSPPRGVWHLGPLPIRAYALFIIVGIVVALVISDRRWAKRGGERGVVYDIALWVVPFGLVGGRLYHLATDWQTYFAPGGAGFAAALRIWDGGLGIWGAVALGAVGGWIGCRRHGIPLPALMDAVAPGLVLAQGIGRLGNYFNQELYGRETTLPWGLEIFYRRDPSGFVDPHSLDGVSTGQLAFVVQPTFLYELVWNVVVFVLLLYIDRRYVLSYGRLFAMYVALYCVGRFWVELLRDDTATHIAGIRINSFTSTFVFIGAVVYIILARKGREDPETLRGFTEEEEAAEPELATVGASAGAVTGAAVEDAGAGGDEKVGPEDDKGEGAVAPEVGTAEQSEAVEAAPEEPVAGEPDAAVAEEAAEPDAEVAEVAEEAGEPDAAVAEEPEAEETKAAEPEGPEVAPGPEAVEAAEPAEAGPDEPTEPSEPSAVDAAEAVEEVPAEPEPDEPASDEPELEKPEGETPAAQEPEPAEPAVEGHAAQEPQVEEPTAEKLKPDEPAVEESEPAEPAKAEADETATTEQAAKPAEEPEPPTADDQTPARRRWGLRRRNRG